MALMESVVQRLPFSPAMFYLPVGYALGPSGMGLLDLNAREHAAALTMVTQAALLISLFTVGLKLRVPLTDRIWWLPVRLGFVAMLLTVGLITVFGQLVLALPLGAAVLLAAILAPTDPILASDVQIRNVGDRDRIRFSLSGEGGLNDGTAYPFVMLGLALLAVPEAAHYLELSALWLTLWGIVAGMAIGWFLGWGIGRLVVFLRHRYRLALGMEEFLTLGLIASSYGITELAHGIGFIAVFATGVAMRYVESCGSGAKKPEEILHEAMSSDERETALEQAPAYMTETVLDFNQQLEHIAEFFLVILLGILLSGSGFSGEGVVVAIFLFLLLRPLAVFISMLGVRRRRMQNALLAWFGIRGIGSLYYLMFALQYDWLPQFSDRLISLVLTVVAISVVVHGVSSTPLMEFYRRKSGSR
jgi:NhaP-type Na+/H+ or K+/H+ antiporter